MQKRLQFTLILTAFFTLLFFLPEKGSELYAQLIISDDQPLVVRFTASGISREDVRVVLLNSEEESGLQRWLPYNPDAIPSAGESYYLDAEDLFVSPGVILSEADGRSAFFTLDLTNDTGFGIGGLDTAFDFIYSTEQGLNNFTLSLRYRVNDRSWVSLAGSQISSAAVSLSAAGDEWSSFSTQIKIEDIYLRRGDQIELQWVFESVAGDQAQRNLPLFLQRVDVIPHRQSASQISRGSFIITEIFPSFRVDGETFEYVELFNPSAEPLSLKGVEMVTSAGSMVIEREMEIPAYELAVFSNRDISELPDVSAFYLYEGDFLTENGGSVEFIQNGRIIAGSLFEASEPGVSKELQRAVLAERNGYSSLQNLSPAEESFYGNLMGSPGSFGSTIPFYRKQVTEQGWYLISPPGLLPERFNPNPSLEWFDLEGRRIRPDRIRAHQPVALYKTGNEPVTIIAEGNSANQPGSGVAMSGYRDSFAIASLTGPGSADIMNLADSRNRQLAPIVLAWDESQKRFTFRDEQRPDVNDWSPVIYNRGSHDGTRLSLETGTLQTIEIPQRLSLQLYTGTESNRMLADEVLIGFTEQDRFRNERFDLPVVDGHFVQGYSFPQRDLLYLTLPEASFSANSFVHIPSETAKQIGVGFKPGAGTSGVALLSWNLPGQFNENWTLTLEDLTTGVTVNMRDENSIRFRYSSEPEETRDETSVRGLHSQPPSLRNRFILKLEPLNQVVSEVSEQVSSGSVELYPNYPNPFNPATTISFSLPEERMVRLGVINIVGQQVALLIDETLRSGDHSVVWDASSSPSGIYIVQLETGGRILTRKITLIK